MMDVMGGNFTSVAPRKKENKTRRFLYLLFV